MNILPQPKASGSASGCWIKTHRGENSTGVHIAVFADPSTTLAPQIAVLRELLFNEQMFDSECVCNEDACDIALALCLKPRPLPEKLAAAGFADERHRIDVGPSRIKIEAATPQGIACAIQSLRQMLSGQRGTLSLPCGVIDDEPAMVWRGLHLDVSRHFWDVATVKRQIDLMAFHKFNVFHWHLTDDQGWRLPVDGYPKLTEVAAWRSGTMIGHEKQSATNPVDSIPHGGFYTHDEIRGVVAYAAARGIHVLPEVDVPGHVQALVAAYPEFGCVPAPFVRKNWGISPYALNLEPITFQFLADLVGTLSELFPFQYIHMGGDEVMTDQWAALPRIQEQKHLLGIETDRGIQHYFTNRLQEILDAYNRHFIGWDEIMESGCLNPESAVMFWRELPGEDHHHLVREALGNGNGLVLANLARTYFDLYQMDGPARDLEPLASWSSLPLEKVYDWDPFENIPVPLREGVFGAQGQIWTEYMPTRNHVDYMAFPRACALAQVLWTGENREPLPDFTNRLRKHLSRLDRLSVTYRPLNTIS